MLSKYINKLKLYKKMNFILFILIGALAGFLAGQILKGRGFGFLVNLIVGIIGGVVGGCMFGLLGIGTGSGIIGSLITATVGAIVFLWILSLFKRN